MVSVQIVWKATVIDTQGVDFTKIFAKQRNAGAQCLSKNTPFNFTNDWLSDWNTQL